MFSARSSGYSRSRMNSIPPRARLCGPLLVALLSLSAPAAAETTPEDRASADQLYNDASKLMSAAKYAEACPKLSASQKLDPAIGTLLKLGFCFTYTGQTASAWASFNDAEAMARKAGDRARGDEAAKRAHELEAKLSKLVIESAAADVEVRRDGAVVDHGVLGTALPVDPGAHAISASAAGREPWTGSVTVAPGPGTTTVKVPALVAAAVAPIAAVTPPVGAGATEPAVGPAPAPGWSTQRKVGAGVGAVGLAGIVVGSVFGAMTLSKTSAGKDHCSTEVTPHCDPAGRLLYADATTTANVSNVAMAVGGAAVIGGVVLFLTAPAGAVAKTESARWKVVPLIGAGSGGVFMQGVW
jgi:serine/threonine-protein kinase